MLRFASQLLLAAAAAVVPAAGISAQPAGTPRWERFFDHEEGGDSALDRASLVRNGAVVRVWARWDRSAVADSPFREANILEEVNCEARTAQILAFVAWDRQGSEIARNQQPGAAETAAPGTVGAALIDTVCVGPAQ